MTQALVRYTHQHTRHWSAEVAEGDAFAFVMPELTTKTATDTRAGTELIRGALRGMLDGLERVLAERLSQDDAVDRLTVPPAEAARVLVTMTRGNVVMESVYQDPSRLRATVETLVDMIVRAD